MEPTNQEVVNEPVEPTTPAEPTTVETQAPDNQTTPAGESTEPDKKVSEVVPYDRFKAVNDRVKELEAQVAQSPQKSVATPAQFQTPVPSLDPEADTAVRQVFRQELEAARAYEFQTKHAAELADPVLRGTVQAIIQEANAQGQAIPQEEALAKAHTLLSERSQPLVDKAEKQALSEGQDLAQAKIKAGAIGDTTKATPPVDPESMSATEFATYLQLPRRSS